MNLVKTTMNNNPIHLDTDEGNISVFWPASPWRTGVAPKPY